MTAVPQFVHEYVQDVQHLAMPEIVICRVAVVVEILVTNHVRKNVIIHV